MADNIHPFTPAAIRLISFSPDESVIRTLESLLTAARRGEILGIAGIVEYPGQWRAIATGSVQQNCGPFIGWLEILQQEMVHVHMAATNERNHQPPPEEDGDGDGEEGDDGS